MVIALLVIQVITLFIVTTASQCICMFIVYRLCYYRTMNITNKMHIKYRLRLQSGRIY